MLSPAANRADRAPRPWWPSAHCGAGGTLGCLRAARGRSCTAASAVAPRRAADRSRKSRPRRPAPLRSSRRSPSPPDPAAWRRDDRDAPGVAGRQLAAGRRLGDHLERPRERPVRGLAHAAGARPPLAGEHELQQHGMPCGEGDVGLRERVQSPTCSVPAAVQALLARRLLATEAVAQIPRRLRWRGGGGRAVTTVHAWKDGVTAWGLPQTPAAAVWWRWSLPRLWPVISNRHSVRTLTLPRRWKYLTPQLCLVWPKSGSTVCLRFR